jgi:hypothetical protein
MNRSNLRQRVHALVLLVSAVVLVTRLIAGAQTTTTTTPTTPPAKMTAAQKRAAAAAAKAATQAPASKTAAISNGVNQQVQSMTPASSQTVLSPATSGSGTAPAPGMTSAGTSNTGQAPAGDSRPPVAVQGVGTFVFSGWTLTAYGCFRSNTRLFCDFDTIHQKNVQAGSNIWNNVNLVDDGGKITGRHNAFFVGDDGSQFPTAYIGTTPVRFIMEYDDVNPRYTSISLVRGGQRIQGVPVTAIDASQPAGTIPARGTAKAPAQGTQAAAGSNGKITPGAVQSH